MEQRQLGPGRRSPLGIGPPTEPFTTSTIGLGCMGLSQGYGPVDDTDSIRLINRALDLGVTMLDTAMSYGHGHNETLIGRALAGRQEKVAVATKLGIVRDGSGVHLDGRPDQVQGYCDASLQRLGVEVIDLYYLHRADPAVPIADTVGAMAGLVQQGKVRHLGLSEVTVDQLDRAAAEHPVAAVQLEWSLLWRRPEADIIPAARRHGAGLVPYSPLGRGLLTGTLDRADVDTSDFRRGDARFHGAHLRDNLRQVAVLREIADGLRITPGQLALAWLLAQGPDVVPIPGTRRPDRLAENVAAADIHLAEDDLRRLADALSHRSWSGDRLSFAVPVTRRES